MKSDVEFVAKVEKQVWEKLNAGTAVFANTLKRAEEVENDEPEV